MKKYESDRLKLDIQQGVEKGMCKELKGRIFCLALENRGEKSERREIDQMLAQMTTDIYGVVLNINREIREKSKEEITAMIEKRNRAASLGRIESHAVEKELKDVVYKAVYANRQENPEDILALIPCGVKTAVAKINWNMEDMGAGRAYLYIHEEEGMGYPPPHTMEIAAGIRPRPAPVKESEDKPRAPAAKSAVKTSQSGRILQMSAQSKQTAENA